ncbi:K(+)-stimulated pyrophosphate-energized sodium pump [Candidatus Hakubella thermalkaliphila]|nr:K(+)-stimulated pyrophosphate-energized sodium pump [Candidatus Hakubella thermalkaliphila]
MFEILWIAPVIGGAALVFAGYQAHMVMRQSPGNSDMIDISTSIQQGARAFLRREYKILFMFVLFMFTLIWWTIGIVTCVAYLLGTASAALAWCIGMTSATKANARTAQAAYERGVASLIVAFRAGNVMGMSVVGLGLIGLGMVVLLFRRSEIINAFALGASSIALFARVGGGIFTKAADVGADLVGKLESGIPEDDPRNPAVIADLVGDNVGDVAGMGADLFESYIGAIVAPLIIAVALGMEPFAVTLPLFLAGAGIISSVLGSLFVRTSERRSLSTSLNMGIYVSSALMILATFLLIQWWGADKMGYFWSIIVGLLAGVIIGKITEYYTSYEYTPVKEIAQSAQTGAATTILAGFATGMRSTALPMLAIVSAMLIAYFTGEIAGYGIYGVALSAVGMLSITGMAVSIDAYGPVADNGGGIAEMAKLPPEVRKITDSLDSIGNTTAAIAKGFAIGSAVLTAIALFVAYSAVTGLEFMDIMNPSVLSGLLIGAMLPFLLSSLTVKAVGRAAFHMVEEVRRQFRDRPGILKGTEKPDPAGCVDISTKAALKEMVVPGVLAIAAPFLVGMLLGPDTLGGMLAGTLITGFLIAVMMANAGGAWDNAKKFIEKGEYGGKGTPAHAASIVGDTVGDPFKDTAGPSMNIFIKLISIVSLTFAPLFVRYGGIIGRYLGF